MATFELKRVCTLKRVKRLSDAEILGETDIASSQYYKKHKSPVTLQKLHQHYKYVAFFESA